MGRRRIALLLVFFLNVVITGAAQQDCRFPLQTVPGPILFTPEQETFLGDILAQRVNATNHVIEDESLRGPLLGIANRLVANAPQTGIVPTFSLIDLPDANAFTLPGGRIYVTKKLIAASHSEDELAGVLAHEMGHAYTRQIARDYSEMWSAVLKANSVGDRADIEDKLHRFMDTYAASKALRGLEQREQKEQIEADAFGINLVIRAGYDPKAYADFFERVTEAKAKKGNWFTELFSMKTPDTKRVREMIRNSAPAPTGCTNTQGKMSAEEFARWRHAVVAYSGFGKTESIPADAHKQVMKDPLRSELRHLRFSPDGKYVLAQDDASIYVLTREPFANLFRIDSEGAFNAEFTPDSKSIVFQTEDMRIERWDLEQQQLAESYDLHVPRTCMQSVLSPTGEYMACLQLGENNEFPAQLAILDVKSAEPVWVKKAVLDPSLYELIEMIFGAKPRIDLEFSPDGRYLAGSSRTTQFAFDLQEKKPVQLGKVKDYMHYEFVFLGNETMLGIKGDHGEKSAVVKFPSGEVLTPVKTGLTSLYRPASGNYVIMRPVVHAAAGVVDLATDKFVAVSKTRAIDIYQGILVGELTNGDVGLFKSPTDPPIATVALPKGPMTRFTAVAVSPDFRYVAYSAPMRGAIWDIRDGTRVTYVRGFRGAYFNANDELLTLFPPVDSYTSKGYQTKDEWKQAQSKQYQKAEEGKIVANAARWVTGTNQFMAISQIPRRFDVWQHGPYLLVSERVTEDGKRIDPNKRQLEVRDMVTGQKLWSHNLPGGDWFYNVPGDTLAFLWSLKDDDAKRLLKNDSALKAKVDAFPEKKSVVLIQVLSHRTGQQRFVIPFDTGGGSIEVRDIDVVGDTVMITDSQDRLLILNSKGERTGRIFATRGVLDTTGQMLAAQTEPGRITLFAVNGMQKKQVYTFDNRVAYMAFSGDSKRLIVITADQTFYTFGIH